MSERPRAAVVGTGFIGAVHVEALRRLGIEVTGVVGSSPERARAKALAPVYESVAAMLADPRVDVVHVASPNLVHAEQAAAALEAGRHVVCEKPLGMTSEETRALLALAEASGRVHAVNFNLRFYPHCLEARARVDAGALGPVRLVTGAYLQDWLLRDTDWSWRLDPAQGGALRAVGDIGFHWLDLAQFVTGARIEAVMADLATFIPVRRRPAGTVETFGGAPEDGGERIETRVETEDAAVMLLRFAGGARGTVAVSQVSAGRRNRLALEVGGAETSLAWNGERPDELWIGHRGRPNELLLRDPELLAPPAAAHTTHPGGHAEGYADTFKELYRAVYAAVAEGGPPEAPGYPTFADGHRAALLGDAIARSAGEGRWTAVAEEPA